MTESLYITPVFTKKATVQQDVKEERKEGENGTSDDAVIYSDVRVMGAASEDVQKPTEDSFKGLSVGLEKRNPYRKSAVCLGLLTLLLVAGITGLGIHYFQEQTHWGEDRGLLREENAKIQASYDISNAEGIKLRAENQNLTQRNINITTELQKMIERDCCPRYWEKFKDHCYNVSTSEKTWNESKKDCENRGAHLVIITSKAEQTFITALEVRAWIGLYRQNEDDWKWVDGSNHQTSTGYWAPGQPDNYENIEDCVEIFKDPFKWNDLPCDSQRKWICEKEM